MYENHSHKIADRIVSISQPYIRPIVRDKAKSNVEFGAKVSLSLVDGFSFVDLDRLGQLQRIRRPDWADQKIS